MPQVNRMKIFSYLPNPRIWKAQIAAAYCGVALEIIGDRPTALSGWLWDADARPLRPDEREYRTAQVTQGSRGFATPLVKTPAFLKAHPFGTVPAAFIGEDRIGIFESNSILRATVRMAEDAQGLYGTDSATASRIDSFLDEGLVFAREAQVYLLGLNAMTAELHQRMTEAATFYLQGIERALETTPFLAGDALTLCDIAFACDLGQFLRERFMINDELSPIHPPIAVPLLNQFPRTKAHLLRLGAEPHFAQHFGRFLEGLDEP